MSNRLINETSPYLLQHANNPVDWHPWGPEALDRARAEEKLILLSIGYSACHWCHVMEHESFENPLIAEIMNRHFVSIKVDREERPDLDQIYMTAVQMMTGSGGWPMTMFLLPTGEPIFGGTYFPPDDRYGRPGFRRVLETIAQAWQTQRSDIVSNAKGFRDQLSRQALPKTGSEKLDRSVLDAAASALASRFDPNEGGFGGAPKFPPAMAIDFLLRYHYRTGAERALEMAEFTLQKMAHGGIYDQVGGGFHRYSTDDRWLVPHFEKMLYDNALLARVYTDAHRATGNRLYKRIAEETLDFVMREIRSPDGAFYSTLDADSEGVEGKFYVWTLDEFREVLSDDAAAIAGYFDVTAHGNWEDANILHVSQDADEKLQSKIETAKKKLFAARESRIRPGRDEKALTDWNGLMLRAFAEAAAHFERDDYRAAAEMNADFILRTLWDGRRLLHSYKDGRARFNGYVDDYANFADGLFALYELTFNYRWLEASAQIADRMIEQFWDDEGGGFYFTSKDHEALLTRTKDLFDNATPSGNAVAADVLLKLAAVLDRKEYREKAEAVFQSAAGILTQYGPALGRMLAAFDFYIGPVREIALVGAPDAFVSVLRKEYLPRAVVAAGSDERIAILQNRPMVNGRPTAYVCENFTCKEPALDVEIFERQLKTPE